MSALSTWQQGQKISTEDFALASQHQDVALPLAVKFVQQEVRHKRRQLCVGLMLPGQRDHRSQASSVMHEIKSCMNQTYVCAVACISMV